MFERKIHRIAVCMLSLICYTLCLSSMTLAQNETSDKKIIERYKLMLERKPKEGSTFDRLYQFYLEGAGLEQMVADYQAEAEAKPNAPNIQLILGHIHKRLGKDAETLAAYQRAVELAPGDYYPYAALGQANAMLRRPEEAIAALTQAAELATQSQTATLDDLTALYKALGRAYFSQNRVDNAISAWAKIAELDPQNIFARIELAELFREQELYAQAIAQHRAIVEIKKDDPYRVCMSHREIGKIQAEKGDYQDALASYDTALALTAPDNWLRKDLQHRIIAIYADDGNWEGLITHYQEKLAQTPNDVALIGLLASAYIENQQLDEGIAGYRKGLTLAPTDTDLRLNLIKVLRNAERFDEAAAEYETLSEVQPDNFHIYRELGELYLQLEDENRARRAYQRMIDRDPENAGTRLSLAEIYAEHEWFDDAIAEYEKAISLASDNPDYMEYFGEFYLRQGNREQAVETWNCMVEGDLGTAPNYDRLAQLLNAKDFRTEAITASRKAVALDPEEFRYREALARLLMENKEYDEALTQYTEAAKLAPNAFFAKQMGDQQLEIYRQQGTLAEKLEALETAPETFDQQKQLTKMYLKLGNISYALKALTKAKALQPNDVRVNRWLAELYIRQGRRDDANTIYTHLVEIDPKNAREYYAKITRYHLNAMDFDAATYAAKRVVAHSPRNPEGHQLLAEIAEQAGDYETATNNLKQAIRLRPEATDIRAELAAMYKLVGDFRQAIKQYWRCWELSDDVEDKLGFVKSLFEAYNNLGWGGEFEEKLKHKSKAKPSDMAPILALARVYRLKGDLPSARAQLAQALDRERDNPELLGQLVQINLDLGTPQDALNYQQRLVKIQPHPIHQQRLGELLFKVGREQEAIQKWTKLLYAKNQTLEAEVKLATLLIRHGLLEEALSVLDRAGEKAKDAKVIYQVGVMLVEMSEYDRAQSHFERILQMPKPQGTAAVNPNQTYGHPGIHTVTFQLVQGLAQKIQGHPFQPEQTWQPNSFAEAQAGALVQLMTIAQRQETLGELIQKLEVAADANPKDVQSLEQLVQIYTLTENTDKVAEITDRLIVASPNNPVYQDMRLGQLMMQNPDYETVKKQLDQMTGLLPNRRYAHIAQYADKFYRQGNRADAEKLLDELEDAKVTELNTGSTLVNTLIAMGKLDGAAHVIAQLPIPMMTPLSPAQQQWQQYTRMYHTLADAYTRTGQTDKGVELLWAFCDRTKPKVTNARRVVPLASSSYTIDGYTQIQFSYPSPTTYYNQDRLQYLRLAFLKLWTKEQLAALYAKLQNELETAKGRDRIYPGLGLSYCYWWEGNRDKAQEILATLQSEFPDDLTLKLNTVLVSIQTGQQELVLNLLDELAEADPRNRRQYYELMLQFATHTGNTRKVRDLITKVLSSPSGARELYQFSQKMHQNGLTQYAIAAAKKAVPLAMEQRDPHFLIELSRYLEKLGRGLDATRLAERAMQFANQPSRYGQMMPRWYFQRAANLVGRSKASQEREPRLVEAAKKNPDSFQAQMRLAAFYESTNQLKKASAAFEAALALRPKDSMTRQRYAHMLERRRRFSEAVDQYMVLLRDNPNALTYNFSPIINTFLHAGEVDKLVSLAKEAMVPAIGQAFPTHFVQEVAQQCMRRHLPKAAVELYEKLIEVRPNSHNTYAALASAYNAAGQHTQAILFLREKLETEAEQISQDTPTQVAIVSKLIELAKASDRIEDLVTEYEAKLAEKPEDQLLLYLVAAMKIAENDPKGADPLLNQLLDDEAHITNVDLLNSLADAYRGASYYKRELRLLETAIERINPQNMWQLQEVYQKLGVAYTRNGEREKAKWAVRKQGTIFILLNGGNNFWAQLHLANIYQQNQMPDDVEAIYLELSDDLFVDPNFRAMVQRQLDVKQGKSEKTNAKTNAMTLRRLRTVAQQHMQRGEYSVAADLYKQIIADMPEDLESRAQLATIHSRQKKYDTAIAEWEALLEADPENTKYQDGVVNAYEAAGKIDTAIELAQQYIKSDESGLHYARLAKLYATGKRVDEAIEAYEKAIKLSPGNAKVYRELAQLYLRKNDLDAAEKAFSEALQYTGEQRERRAIEQEIMEIHDQKGTLEQMLEQAAQEGRFTFETLQQQAQKYRTQGEWEKAKVAYKSAINMTTDDWKKKAIATELIGVYAHLGQTQAAIEFYETLTRTSLQYSIAIKSASGFGIRIYFGDDETRQNLIKAYQDKGKLDDLLAHLEQRLETGADNPATLETIADIHRTRGDHAKAAETYQRLCKTQPGNVRSFYHAAAAFNKSGQPELAQTMLNKGKTARPESSQWSQDMWRLIALAEICITGELYDTAIQLVEAATATSQNFVTGSHDQEILYHTRATAYLGAKRYAEAAEAYQRLADVAEREYMKKAAQEGIRTAYRAGNLSEQLIVERAKAVAENPDDPDAHFALGQAYELKDTPDEAIAAYERARALNPDSAVILEPLAKLYVDADPEKAKPLYKQLIKLADTPITRIQKRNALIELYQRQGDFDATIAELLETIRSAPDEWERNIALKALWDVYVAQERIAEGISTFEKLASQIKNNPTVYEGLGDAYKETDNPEKANSAYAQWVAARQKEIERRGQSREAAVLASELLAKQLMPEKTLELVEHASQIDHPNLFVTRTLAEAYLVNEQYDAAETTFKRAFAHREIANKIANRFTFSKRIWSSLMRAGKVVKDTERFTQLVDALVLTHPPNAPERVYANLVLAMSHRAHNQPEEAEQYMRKSGVVPENAWWIIGPFDQTDRTDGGKRGTLVASVEIDPTMTYEGKTGQVSWKQVTDQSSDGIVDFAQIFGFEGNAEPMVAPRPRWLMPKLETILGYAQGTVNSPDERQAQIRITTLNTTEIWVNGKSVLTINQDRGPMFVPYHTVPVTLNLGANSILVKASGGRWGCGFTLWLTDTDGKPLEDLTFPESNR